MLGLRNIQEFILIGNLFIYYKSINLPVHKDCDKHFKTAHETPNPTIWVERCQYNGLTRSTAVC